MINERCCGSPRPYRKTQDHHTKQGGDLRWRGLAHQVTSLFDHVITSIMKNLISTFLQHLWPLNMGGLGLREAEPCPPNHVPICQRGRAAKKKLYNCTSTISTTMSKLTGCWFKMGGPYRSSLTVYKQVPLEIL